MDGYPVGHAMDPFSERFGTLGTLVAGADWAARQNGGESVDLQRYKLWAAFQDARNYIVLGDPAARLYSRTNRSRED